MAKGEPSYRAPLIQTYVEGVRALDAGPSLLKRVDPVILEEIDAAPLHEWLPFRFQLVMSELVFEQRGPAAVEAVSEFVIGEAIRNPIFEDLRRGFIDLFGATPSTIMSAMPRGMRASGRNVGRILVDVESGGTSGEATWTDLPELLRRESVARGHIGTYRGLLAWAGAQQIEIEHDFRRLAKGEARYSVRWQEADEDAPLPRVREPSDEAHAPG